MTIIRYNPFYEGRSKILSGLEKIVEDQFEWRDPAEEVKYMFDRITKEEVLGKTDFMHPPPLKKKERPATVPPLETRSKPKKEDPSEVFTKSKTWFLKEWEVSCRRKDKRMEMYVLCVHIESISSTK